MNKIFNQHLGIRIPNTLGRELKEYSEKEMISVSDIVRRGILIELNALRDKHKRQWSVK